VKIGGVAYRSIWLGEDGWSVRVIDQTWLPHELVIATLTTVDDSARAIRTMQVRGAPLIGATAAYGVCLALRDDPSDAALERAAALLAATRPTAVNLRWALDELVGAVTGAPDDRRVEVGYRCAAELCERDVATCRSIGEHGLALLRELAARKGGRSLNILTHCNAGWLATVDWGTALAPVYLAHDAGIEVHVWVDETRPRYQGSALTAFELGAHGVPYTVIVDSAGGHLMQRGRVDVCLVGTDRTTATGDVANKVGTYLKALAAMDNGVPFYVAAPSSSIDWKASDGFADIPIEERDPREVTRVSGRSDDGAITTVSVVAPGSPAANVAFDVTPARMITGLITERGVCAASAEGLRRLFPERMPR
jgi:methylthioribose-1-phosphate isomerase